MKLFEECNRFSQPSLESVEPTSVEVERGAGGPYLGQDLIGDGQRVGFRPVQQVALQLRIILTMTG